MTYNKLTKIKLLEIVATIKVNYPESYSAYNDEQMDALINCWYESLNIYPLELINQAVKKVIETSEFAPKLSTIIKEIKAIENAGAPTDMELWAELEGVLDKVYRISRYLPYSQYSQWTDEELNKIYDGLSDELKLFVVNVSTLVDIAEMTDDNLSFERARFFKQMPVLRQHYADSQQAKQFLQLTDNGEQVKKIADKKRK